MIKIIRFLANNLVCMILFCIFAMSLRDKGFKV
nr:MAG TPA: hypothetical protein [Caudoviricetes sp.]